MCDFFSSYWENQTCTVLPCALSPWFLLAFWLNLPQPSHPPCVVSPTLTAPSRTEGLDKEHNASLRLSEGETGGRAGGSISSHQQSKEVWQACGGALEPNCHQKCPGLQGTGCLNTPAMFSHWPEVRVVSMALEHGDRFQSAAAGPWAVKFLELGGLWDSRLWLPYLESSSPHPHPPSFYYPLDLSWNITSSGKSSQTLGLTRLPCSRLPQHIPFL